MNLISIKPTSFGADYPQTDINDLKPLSYEYSYVVNDEALACFEALNQTNNGFTINSRAEYGLGNGDVLTYIDGKWVAAPGTGTKYKMGAEAIEFLEDDGTTSLYGVNLNLIQEDDRIRAETDHHNRPRRSNIQCRIQRI